MNIGEMYTFKRTAGRGRPFVGEVVRKAGLFTYMKMKDGTTVAVYTNRILNKYEFKPYNTKARRELVSE